MSEWQEGWCDCCYREHYIRVQVCQPEGAGHSKEWEDGYAFALSIHVPDKQESKPEENGYDEGYNNCLKDLAIDQVQLIELLKEAGAVKCEMSGGCLYPLSIQDGEFWLFSVQAPS